MRKLLFFLSFLLLFPVIIECGNANANGKDDPLRNKELIDV